MAEKSFETNVKSMISSLLTSTPLACTMRQLKLDYRNMIGEDIPFQKLGYGSLERFLLSIPDTVKVCGTGPDAIVKPVVSEKSAHINELVMKQKVSCIKKRKAPTGRRRYVQQMAQVSPVARGTTQKIIYPKPQTVMKTPTKQQTVSQHQHCYQSVVSESVHGPVSRVSVARNISASISVPAVRNISDRADVPVSTVSAVRNIEHTSQPIQQNWTPKYKYIEPEKDEISNLSPSSRSFFELFTPLNQKPDSINSSVDQKSDSYSQNVFLKSNTSETNTSEFGLNNDTSGDASRNISIDKNRNNSMTTYSIVRTEPNESFVENESDLNSYSDVNISRRKHWQFLPHDVKSNEEYDSKSNVNYVKEEYPDLNQGGSFSNNTQKLRVSENFEKEDISIKIPKNVQSNLKSLISLYPEGLWCGQLPTEYFKKFKKELNYEAFKYKSLIAMCMDLPEIFHYVRPSREDFKLYDRSRPLPKEAEKTFTMASYSIKQPAHIIEKPLPDLQSILFTDYLPGDIVINEVIPRQFIGADVKEGDYLEIGVAEIFDLSKFWVYLRANGLDELMDDMQPFYQENREKYLIPSAFVKEGLYCVAKFYSEYHRAVIVKANESSPLVTLFYVDYGTVCKISKSKLYFLAKQFGELPFQSIRSRLANIYPIYEDMTWSQADIRVFYDLVSKREIVAQVNKILDGKQILDLYLIDRETNECINDILVKEKIALYTNQKRLKCSALGYKPVVKYLHLFPSFPDLEFGVVPSVSELAELLNQGITYDFIYPEYFYRANCDNNIAEIEKEHDLAIERAKELYKRGNLFPKLTAHNIREIQASQVLDLSIFGPMEDEIKDFMKRKMKNTDFTYDVDRFGMPAKKYKSKKSRSKKASEDIIKSEIGIQVEDSDYFKDDLYLDRKRKVQEFLRKNDCSKYKKDDECSSYRKEDNEQSDIDSEKEDNEQSDIDNENLASDTESGASFATQISRDSNKSEKPDIKNIDNLLLSFKESVSLKDSNTETVDDLNMQNMLLSPYFSANQSTLYEKTGSSTVNRSIESRNMRQQSVDDLICFESPKSSEEDKNVDHTENYDVTKSNRVTDNVSDIEQLSPTMLNTRAESFDEKCDNQHENRDSEEALRSPKINPENLDKEVDHSQHNASLESMETSSTPNNTMRSSDGPFTPNMQGFIPPAAPPTENNYVPRQGQPIYQSWSDPNTSQYNTSVPPGFRPPNPSQPTVYYPWSDPNNPNQQNLSAPPGFRQPNPANRFVPPPPGFYPGSAPRPMYTPRMYNPSLPWLQQPQPIFVFSNPTFLVQDSAPDFFSVYNNNLMTNLGRMLPHQGNMQPPHQGSMQPPHQGSMQLPHQGNMQPPQ